MRISDWSSDVCSSDLNLVAGRADVGRNRGADLERTVNLAALDVQVERRDKVEIILVGRRRAKVFLGDADDLDRRILVELVRPEGHLDAVAVLDNPAVLADDLRSEEHTSELQSLMRISYAVFCLKKKKNNYIKPA